MKKITKIFFASVLSVGFGIAAQAQNTSLINTDISASAVILDALTLTKNLDVNFGNLSADTPAEVFLDPKGQANKNVGTTAVVGRFILDGNAGSSVKVTWPATIQLTEQVQSGTPEEITYKLLVSGLAANTPASSTVYGAIGLATTTNVTLGGDGLFNLYVGGGFDQFVGKKSGTYQGTANFTVEYN